MWPQCYINSKCLHEVFSLHTRYINRTYIGVARGDRGPWRFQIFRISSHFVLQEAASQAKYCGSPKIKHFYPPKILGMPCHCARKYLNSCFVWVRLGFLWTKDEKAADSERSLESFR